MIHIGHSGKVLAMKKLLWIVVLGFLYCSNLNAVIANCYYGNCEINLSPDYEFIETNCSETIVMEEVEIYNSYFKIVDTGEKCKVLDSR